MDEIYQDTDTVYVTSQMARRICYQQRIMPELEKGTRAYETTMEEGYRELPREWLVIAEDWCKDHKIGMEHGVMALMHLKSIFGMDFDDIVLRVILDDAWEIAKTIKVFKKK